MRRQRLSDRCVTGLIWLVYAAIFLFILYPILALFYHSLWARSGLGLMGAWRIVRASQTLLKNSLLSAVLTSLLSTSLTVAVGLVTAMSRPSLKRIIRLALLLTMISPPFVTSLSYINLFGRRGLITYELLGLSLNPYGMTGVILMQSLSYLSLHALLLAAAIERIPSALIKSGLDLGASPSRVITELILPELKPTIGIVALLNFIKSLADFSTPAIIGGRFNTLATAAYLSMVAGGDINRAAVLNSLIFIPALIVYLFYRRYHKKENMKDRSSSFYALPRRGLVYHFCALVTLFVLTALILQYGALIAEAFIQRQGGQIHFTLAHFRTSSVHLSGAMLRSILYAVTAALGGTIIGFLLGYALHDRPGSLVKTIDFLATLPYVLPGSFFGIAYIYAFRAAPLALTGTAAIVVLNMLFKQLPFNAQVGSEAVQNVDRAIPQSIADLGGSRLRQLTDGFLPLSRGPLFVSFVNSFASSMCTVGSILFLVYPGQKVATIVLFDLIQSGKYNTGSALALWIMGVTLLGNGLFYLFIARQHRQPGKDYSLDKGERNDKMSSRSL